MRRLQSLRMQRFREMERADMAPDGTTNRARQDIMQVDEVLGFNA